MSRTTTRLSVRSPEQSGLIAPTAAAVGASFVTACTLVLPWFRVAGRARSSIDLISSAGALDVIEGGTRLAVVGLWLVLPVLSAIALFMFALKQPNVAAILSFVVGAAVLLVIGLVLFIDEVGLAWGAWLAAASGATAAVCAIMVLTSARTAT